MVKKIAIENILIKEYASVLPDFENLLDSIKAKIASTSTINETDKKQGNS